MSSKTFVADALEQHKCNATIDMVNDSVKIALLADFAPTYSAWAASTTYSEGDIVIPTTRNGRRYRATTSGVSASSEPIWPTTDGETVVDNEVTFEEYGGELADNEFFNDVSGNELADGDGYTAGGKALSGKVISALSNDPAVTMFDMADVTWSDLNKTIRLAWIYVAGDTPGSNDYTLGYMLLDDTPGDVTVSGVNFTIGFDDQGVFHFGRKVNV